GTGLENERRQQARVLARRDRTLQHSARLTQRLYLCRERRSQISEFDAAVFAEISNTEVLPGVWDLVSVPPRPVLPGRNHTDGFSERAVFGDPTLAQEKAGGSCVDRLAADDPEEERNAVGDEPATFQPGVVDLFHPDRVRDDLHRAL